MAPTRRCCRWIGILTVALCVTPGCSDDRRGGDAGSDVGRDADLDAGPDAAVEAGTDAGTDAGADAGPDAESPPADAGRDGGADAPRVGPLVELPLIDAPYDRTPFNHSAEVSVAAVGDDVVVAMINMHYASASSFDTTGFHKHVGLAVSREGGGRFSPVSLGSGDKTTDPVVRADDEGRFWLVTWDTGVELGAPFTGRLLRSAAGDPTSWSVEWSGRIGDKPWLAVDGTTAWVAAEETLLRYRVGEAPLFRDEEAGLGGVIAGFAEDGVARFASGPVRDAVDSPWVLRRWRWSGGTPAEVGSALVVAEASVDVPTADSGAYGPTPTGTWLVYSVQGPREVKLRLEDASGTFERSLGTPGTPAFLPAATTDDAGRLHAVWYESRPTEGVLLYTRSETDDLRGAFLDPVVVDPDACPAGGWTPAFTSSGGGRRLREYIDLAVVGPRVHVGWTHAPQAPARAHATRIDWD